MTAPGYRAHVEPAHPLLFEVFHSLPRSAGRAGLEAAIADLRGHFVYRPVRGRLGFDRLREARADDGAGPSTANCFDLSTLLVSHLRRSGWSPDEVYVVLCDAR